MPHLCFAEVGHFLVSIRAADLSVPPQKTKKTAKAVVLFLVEISGILRDTWHFALFRWRETRPLRAEKCLCSSRYALRAAALSVTPQKTKKTPKSVSFCFGGDKRDRTADLLTASQALSQLSYTPGCLYRIPKKTQFVNTFFQKSFLFL